MFHIIWSIIVGFIVGVIARWIVPGAEHYGFIMTTVVGIVGSIIGGFIGTLFNKPAPGQKFHTAGFLMSIVGAVILLFLLRFIVH
ncbi:GlsB/YeaQ/YmgE family stress response membrane protein [Dyella psychrodurans]|uniref:GlsB/YeaQ/YmgE family stress response membrane protein n=1 Tax=Dyella psychrodurans TaxID=1927960 RepID=A0A370XEI8_9GAMM|nr:GlsB/YeaQ/YmgE family stress response membrane protein [Dyella psychrodurans]RDS86631.1 GlsB/YeaQ/YmgE family stress response membrane protein [Dyella psychrodurans]